MFNLEQYPSILMHFKTLSTIIRKNSSGWYEMFCPYCDDKTRKANPSHGHFHISSEYPFAHCFRCGHRSSLIKTLIDTGFTDKSILQELSKYGNIGYSSSKKTNIASLSKNIDIQLKFISNLYSFIDQYPNDFLIWKNYIYSRCGEINPIDYYLLPNYIQRNLVVQISNSSNKIVTNRFINPQSNLRYLIPKEKPLYYFQNINDINDYKNIIFCEGAFDLINLHRYSSIINDGFYIAIGGSNYKQVITTIVSNFLLIGNYIINVVFDKNVLNKIQLISQIKHSVLILNPNIRFEFYEPSLYKDVSDCIFLNNL